jgi:thymidylate synthase (FAD)
MASISTNRGKIMVARAILLATTVLYRGRFADTPYSQHPYPSDVETVLSADELAEFAGRSHEGSWDRPDMATNRRYLKALLTGGYFRELEHASATFYITGISRGLTHDLLRNRQLSVSELSQDHIDVRAADVVTPQIMGAHEDMTTDLQAFFEDACDLYEDFTSALEARGYSPTAARDAARSVLPNGTETAILVTGNIRAWRDVISASIRPGMDLEARDLSITLLRQLRDVAPNSFQDMGLSQPLTAAEVRELYALDDDEQDELSSALQLSANVRAA